MSQLPRVEVGDRWLHYRGGEYVVLHLANVGGGDGYEPTVVYQGTVNQKVWTRPLRDWNRSMTLLSRMGSAKSK